jgi:hypothetical protein|tara:strand:+ start:199 stop:777 length:579 start_codon:yes stop_codon:yes gene_type:complete
MLINERIYFIHIPRTGGRHLYNLILANNHKGNHFLFSKEYKNKEIPHLTYPEYEEFLGYIPEKKFSIVREPVDRFFSIIQNTHWILEKEIESIFKNKNSFFSFMNKMRLNKNEKSNWFNTQSDFLSKDVKLWRFEKGFKQDFKKWLENNFDLKIPVGYNTILNENTKKINLNKKQIEWVKDYYYKDYKLLDY